MYWIRCSKCNFMEETESLNITKCPLCNSPIYVEDEKMEQEFENQIQQQIEKNEIDTISEAIKRYGNKKLWKKVEEIQWFEARLFYRYIFFKAGGKIPTKEMKI